MDKLILEGYFIKKRTKFAYEVFVKFYGIPVKKS